MDTKNTLPRVAVLVVTYNQERYIRECIESALHQETIYPMDIIVGNDCSTDGTATELQRLSQEYPNRLIVFNRRKNMGLVENTIDLFHYILSHDYTYTAMLDGDDYWCDIEKIQRQVDLMEAHPDVAICCANLTTKKQDTLFQSNTHNPRVEIRDMFYELSYRSLENGTIMHRNAFLQNVPFDRIVARSLLLVDHSTNVFMAHQGKVAYEDTLYLYWRRHKNTISGPHNREHAFRYAEHEVRQAMFLGDEFPHTPYELSQEYLERHKWFSYYNWALSANDYEAIRQCLSSCPPPFVNIVKRQKRDKIYN